MKVRVTYLCYHCITGKQDICYSYIADTEEQALSMFKAEADIELEINDIFIEEMTDEEAEEELERERKWEEHYRRLERKHNEWLCRVKIHRTFRKHIPKQQRKQMESVW